MKDSFQSDNKGDKNQIGPNYLIFRDRFDHFWNKKFSRSHLYV